MKINLVFLVILAFSNEKVIELMSNDNDIDIDYSQGGSCKVVKCGSSLCSSQKGECKDLKACICKKGYTSREEDGIVQCCYTQKSLLTAVLLEGLLGFGFGHFYLNNIALFFAKFFSYVILCCSSLIILIYWCSKKENHTFIFKASRSICFLLCFSVVIAWQIADPIIFLLGGYTDSEGAPLY